MRALAIGAPEAETRVRMTNLQVHEEQARLHEVNEEWARKAGDS